MILSIKLADIRKQLNEYLSKSQITPSTYSAPTFLQEKKNSSLGIFIDYRSLNQYTRPNKYLLFRIGDLLDRLANEYCLSSIYLHTRY